MRTSINLSTHTHTIAVHLIGPNCWRDDDVQYSTFLCLSLLSLFPFPSTRAYTCSFDTMILPNMLLLVPNINELYCSMGKWYMAALWHESRHTTAELLCCRSTFEHQQHQNFSISKPNRFLAYSMPYSMPKNYKDIPFSHAAHFQCIDSADTNTAYFRAPLPSTSSFAPLPMLPLHAIKYIKKDNENKNKNKNKHNMN